MTEDSLERMVKEYGTAEAKRLTLLSVMASSTNLTSFERHLRSVSALAGMISDQQQIDDDDDDFMISNKIASFLNRIPVARAGSRSLAESIAHPPPT